MESLSLGSPAPISWRDFPVTPEAAALFAEADLDRDGQVGRADAKVFFLRTGVPGPQLAKARHSARASSPRNAGLTRPPPRFGRASTSQTARG